MLTRNDSELIGLFAVRLDTVDSCCAPEQQFYVYTSVADGGKVIFMPRNPIVMSRQLWQLSSRCSRQLNRKKKCDRRHRSLVKCR
jgi:hypothetical protein